MLIYTKEKYECITEKEIMEAQTEACEEVFQAVKEDLVKICKLNFCEVFEAEVWSKFRS